MIAIPGFILSNLLLGAGVSLTSGCASDVVDEPSPVQEEVKVPIENAFTQKGTIFVQTEGQLPYRITFSYLQEDQGHYHMVLSPFLLSPITLDVSDREVRLEVGGETYFNDDAREMLFSYVPEFPWAQIPNLIQAGQLSNTVWELDNWEDQKGFRVRYDNNLLEWKIKEHEPMYYTVTHETAS
ncbi:MAG: hypothetical protein FJ161_00540 [Gammaproteobacteria bacterium]|nr:hypothetical protein [Gammaproteobacteria bacterium]